MSFNAKEFLQSLFETHISGILLPEWMEEYEERAAILEFDGGLDRQEAENQAYIEVTKRAKTF